MICRGLYNFCLLACFQWGLFWSSNFQIRIVSCIFYAFLDTLSYKIICRPTMLASQLFWGKFSPETYFIFTLATFTLEKHGHRAPPIAKGGLRGQAPLPPPHISLPPLVLVSLPRITREGHLLRHAPAALPALPPRLAIYARASLQTLPHSPLSAAHLPFLLALLFLETVHDV
jgi:hypothetical protein